MQRREKKNEEQMQRTKICLKATKNTSKIGGESQERMQRTKRCQKAPKKIRTIGGESQEKKRNRDANWQDVCRVWADMEDLDEEQTDYIGDEFKELEMNTG